MTHPGRTFYSDSVVDTLQNSSRLTVSQVLCSVQVLVKISLLSLFFLVERNHEHYATGMSGHQKSPFNWVTCIRQRVFAFPFSRLMPAGFFYSS